MNRYIIVRADNSEGLELKVRRLLEDGWQLQGGLAVHHIGGSLMFFQAMACAV